MKAVSFQGAQLTSGQRRQLAFQAQARQSFLSPVLELVVTETIAALEQRKEEGAKPEKQWFIERQETGTLCVAEWMGY